MKKDDAFDVVIIGSGPGGYVCAIRCAQLGMKTALIEKYPVLGGTCLNVGCIPSKAWLDSSEKYHQLLHRFEGHGIFANNVRLDFEKMKGRVQRVVKETRQGIAFLMKKHKIHLFHGVGSFKDQQTITITSSKGAQDIVGKNIVLATGSKPRSLPMVTINKKTIITSTEALSLKSLPASLIVIGGGAIGCEMASVFHKLGVSVNLIEYAKHLIPTMDTTLGKELFKVFQKEGIRTHLGHSVEKVKTKKDKAIIQSSGPSGDLHLEADHCLIAVGRRPYTDGLHLEKAGVVLDERGVIPTNANLQTNVNHIYAIGDVTHGPMLAHKAEEEGVFLAETLAQEKPHMDSHLIPSVVYTRPEVAEVGANEKRLKKDKVPYKKGLFPFKASGRARASEEANGLIQVLAHLHSDEILGVQMIGPHCSDLIAEATTAMTFRASAEDIARICHPHPTYSEAFKEACLAATEARPLHL